MKTIKDIKKMQSEPSSKEWFAKHGLPKGLGPKKKEVAKKMGTKKKHDPLAYAKEIEARRKKHPVKNEKVEMPGINDVRSKML